MSNCDRCIEPFNERASFVSSEYEYDICERCVEETGDPDGVLADAQSVAEYADYDTEAPQL